MFRIEADVVGIEHMLRVDGLLSAAGEHTDREIDAALTEFIGVLVAVARGDG